MSTSPIPLKTEAKFTVLNSEFYQKTTGSGSWKAPNASNSNIITHFDWVRARGDCVIHIELIIIPSPLRAVIVISDGVVVVVVVVHHTNGWWTMEGSPSRAMEIETETNDRTDCLFVALSWALRSKLANSVAC